MTVTLTLQIEVDSECEVYGVPVVTIERAWRRADGSLSAVSRADVQPARVALTA